MHIAVVLFATFFEKIKKKLLIHCDKSFKAFYIKYREKGLISHYEEKIR